MAPSPAAPAATICSNMLAVLVKSLGSTTVELFPVLANSAIISVHCVNMKSWLASSLPTPVSWMVSSDSLMPAAMALRWLAMPSPAFSMASASATASVTRRMRSASARSCAAALVRWAALIWFIESSTSAGSAILVMSVETSVKP